MKRIGAGLLAMLLLLSMLLCAVACEDATNDEPKDDENTETLGVYTVCYQDAVIELGKDASSVLKALGEPTSKQFVASCGEGAGDQ